VQSIVVQLKYGALPVPLEVIERRGVGPTLGQASVQRSIRAGTVGLVIVLLFMITYYRLPGVLAALALLIYAAITFALFKLIPVTLTLPAIAGFLLSVGTAVDANILIFERIKEELRRGRSLTRAVETGFDRAWSAIWDSNLAAFITCGVLWIFGNTFGASIVKGFAVTLFIGVSVSMFTAITVTRTFLRVVFQFVGETVRDKQWLLGT
jgi:protein-export membrane protein SecD